MAVSRLCPLAVAFSVALTIAVSTVYTFINGYNESLVYQYKRNGEDSTFPYQNIRLPSRVRPLSYDLYIHPNLTNFKFSGKVKIIVRCLQSTRNVILHLRDLSVGDVKITDSREKSLKIVRRMEHKKNQQYLIAVAKELEQMATYALYLEFKGALSNNMEGFYKSSYKSKSGQVRYLATTQFEATNARSAFPCFDEPAFKAVFRITVVHEENFTALSNMPLETRDRKHNGLLESQFSASVPMPTYLVSFIVCDFDYKETNSKSGKKIRAWSKPDAINSVDFALDVAKRALEYYEEFFNVSYSLPKLDLMAIPDMGGAMENWGLVTFRESAMLFDPASGSPADQKLVAMIVNHELAHQTDQFMLDTLKAALDVDSSQHTHPISVNVNNPAQINEVVDSITYHKSSAVIRMMQNVLGVETFRKGIQIFLKEHQFSNAEASDLWRAMSDATGDLVDVAVLMESWVNQKGFPVVTIYSNKDQRKDGRVSYMASQKRFVRGMTSSTQLKNNDMEGSAWYVPITYITDDSLDKPRTVWMNKTSVTFQLPNSRSSWIKVNVGQTGFYRVNYDEDNWKRLSQQLLNDHKVLSALDRSGLVDDALSLARAGLLDYQTALPMSEYINHELEYVPWTVTLRALSYVGAMLSTRSSYTFYKKFIAEKVKPMETLLGWEDKGEMIDRFLREFILSSLSFHGDADTVNKSLKLFDDWMRANGSHSIPSHLRKIVYFTAVKYGGKMEWEFLWNKYEGCKNAAEREKIISSLGETRNKEMLNRLLENALDKRKVRQQDMIQIIATVAGNTEMRGQAWTFLTNNFKDIVGRLGKQSRAIMFLLEKTTENLNTPKDYREVKSFIQRHKQTSKLHHNEKILETIQTNIYWMDRQAKQVENWFENRG